MNCSNIRPLLSAYYDGDASTEERTQVESHLAGCQDCRRALAEFRAIGSDIRALSMPTPPAGLRRDVWRAIEAQQTRPGIFGAAPARGVVTTLPQPREKSFIPKVLRGMGTGWARALPAAMLVGALMLVMSVILLQRNPSPVVVASMVEQSEIVNYTKAVHVKLYKQVVWEQCELNTSVRRIEGNQPITLTNEVALSFDEKASVMAIQPKDAWVPGVQYQVYIDAPKVGLIVGEGSKLDNAPIILSFSAAMYTPTSTSTPTITPTPTDTPVLPTNTPQPTAVAENSPVPTEGQVVVPTQQPSRPSATTGPKASPTTRVNPTSTAIVVRPTNTPVPPTRTSVTEPTRAIPPTFTAIPTATATTHATKTAVPVLTATATPRRGTPTVTPTAKIGPSPTATPVNSGPCDLVPVRGFGLIWQANRAVRDRIGCPEALEVGVPEVAVQHFVGGTMVWRADLKLIYVFIHGSSSSSGTWVQFSDTWQDTDSPVRATGTPPPGQYEPVRGFGKLWNTNGFVRQSLGWATDQEVGGMTGAWQEFERGEALWTSDRKIYFMYSDDTFQRFEDIFTVSGQE